MRARDRRFPEVVVFVHHFGGDKRSTLRHGRMMNDLGYDCVRFSLKRNCGTRRSHSATVAQPGFAALPVASNLRWGIRGIWAEQIGAVLDAIEQTKIVYSLSMPSACAIDAISRRRARDVAALICDGGPFLELRRCVRNLYEIEYKVRPRVALELATFASLLFWGLGFRRDLAARLNEIPSGFRVLSIRGLRDPLVPESAIDAAWELQQHLSVRTLRLPDGAHLDGLKRFPAEYTEAVKSFLQIERR